MKTINKTLFLLLIAFSLGSCCNNENYKYAITHTNGDIDTIIIRDNHPRMSRENYAELVNHCGHITYAVKVKNFTALGFVPATQQQIIEKKQRVQTFLIMTGAIFLSIFCLIYFLIRPQSNNYTSVKNKSSTIKSIMKYIIYAGGIVIVFKVVLLLIKYLPSIIENYLK